jgi:regulator of sigma E protease
MGGVDIDEKTFAYTIWWRKVIIALSGPAVNVAAAVLIAVTVIGWDTGAQFSREVSTASITTSARLMNMDIEWNSLSGPVALVVVIARLFLADPLMGVTLAWIVLNLSLAFVNLLPLPALDGGQAISAVLLALVRRLMPGLHPSAVSLERGVRTVTFYMLLIFVIVLIIKDAWSGFYF